MGEKELKKKIKELTCELESTKQVQKNSVLKVEMNKYLASMMHELKSPFREINTYVEFIKEDHGEELPEETLDYLYSMEQICNNSLETISNFINYSKAEFRVISYDSVDMKKIVSDVYEMIYKNHQGRNIELIVDEMPHISTDLFLMQQVIYNVLSNSLKYTREKEEAKIHVWAEVGKDCVEYHIKDNGIGFNMGYAGKIFQMFERLHDESYEGSGIGLTMVRMIMSRLNGTVKIFGEVNQGCEVVLELPISYLVNEKEQIQFTMKKNVIRIGVVIDLTGEYAYFSHGKKTAYELAVEEINEAGGIDGKQVEIIFLDGASSTIIAKQKAEQLVRVWNVNILMGGTLSTAREVIREVADENKILYFYNQLYEDGVADHYTFTISAVPEQNMYPMLKYMTKHFGKKVYILVPNYNYGILSAEWAKHYTKKLGAVVTQIEYLPKDRLDYSETVKKIKEEKVDFVFAITVGKYQDHFFNEWNAQGMNHIPVATVSSISNSCMHRRFLAPTLENVYFMAPYMEECTMTEAAKFTQKLRERDNAKLPFISTEAEAIYSAVYLYKMAVEKAKTVETEDVIRALESGEIKFDGPAGSVKVRGESHQCEKNMKLLRLGKQHNVEIIESYHGLYSKFVECVIEKNYHKKGGLKAIGKLAPNTQYNLMFNNNVEVE